MQVRKLLIISALTLALPLLPGKASAQSWFFTPYIGANFGGDASLGDVNDFEDEFEKRVDFGATFGWNPSVIGWEVDLGWSPNFFENTIGPGNFEFGDSNLTTLMGNVLISAPPGRGIRPYGSTGLGLIRSRISGGGDLFDDLTSNDWGFNIGGGVNGQFTDNVGIRGALPYFRSLQDNDPTSDTDLGLSNFDFWRGTVGVAFRW
jgi:opacity protein-like surface antigen